MSEESDLEKTESPTPTRLEKAREKGQLPRSRELTSVLMLVTGITILLLAGKFMVRGLINMLSQGLQFDQLLLSNDQYMLYPFGILLKQTILASMLFFLGLMAMGWTSPMLIGGVLFNPKLLKFDLSKLNIFKGFQRIFSKQALAELFKGGLKALLVGWVTGWFLWYYWPRMFRLIAEPPAEAVSDALYLVGMCGLLIILGLVPMVSFDVFYQLWSHFDKLKMTKQEIKEEFKEQEGDPHIKARIRQQQLMIARRRMMAEVPKADVIVSNPSHYAVALQYQEKKMIAPKVIAKGAGEIALKIKELGVKHRIPQLAAPPLARALYHHSEIGQSIPATLYAAVAEVLAWVYQLKRWQREGGIAPKEPQHLPVPTELDVV